MKMQPVDIVDGFGASAISAVLFPVPTLRCFPDEWAALCQKCHRYVHWAEGNLGLEWDDMRSVD